MIKTSALLALVFFGEIAPHGIGWRTSLDQASAESRGANRILMLDFRADWCGPCKLMEAQVYTTAFMKAEEERVVPVRIDVEKQDEIARRYNVQKLPTVVFTDSWGGELIRHSGSLNAQMMAAVIADLPADISMLNSLEEKLTHDRNNGATLAQMGDVLSSAGLFLAANGYYLRALQHKKPHDEDVLNGLADNSIQLRQTQDAVRWLTRCIKEFPQSTRALQWTQNLHDLQSSKSYGR